MAAIRIGVIDIGIGNVNSIGRSLEVLGANVRFIDDPRQLNSCDKLVFPGVGSFGAASAKLRENEFGAAIVDAVKECETPLMGICLGMQLLGTYGYENGGDAGLGLIQAEVNLLKSAEFDLSLPHIGWNDVMHSNNAMFRGIPQECSFYFVHSFRMPASIPDCEVAHCDYGEIFAAAVQDDMVWGTQFHPEKSQAAGLKLLKNFIEY